jgi:hypothetical protein
MMELLADSVVRHEPVGPTQRAKTIVENFVRQLRQARHEVAAHGRKFRQETSRYWVLSGENIHLDQSIYERLWGLPHGRATATITPRIRPLSR